MRERKRRKSPKNRDKGLRPKGGAPIDQIPSRFESLRRQLEVHRDARDGKYESSEPAQFHQKLVERIGDEMTELAEQAEASKWSLEEIEGYQRLSECLSEDPESLSIAQLDLKERTSCALEAYNVVWLRQLIGSEREPKERGWSLSMLTRAQSISVEARGDIVRKLKSLGITLREGDVSEPLPPRNGLRWQPDEDKSPHKDSRGAKAAAKRRKVLLLLAQGKTTRQITATMDDKNNRARIVREVVEHIRKELAARTPHVQIAQSFGVRFGSPNMGVVLSYLHSLACQLKPCNKGARE